MVGSYGPWQPAQDTGARGLKGSLLPQVVPGRKKRQRLASEPPKPRRGGLGREAAGEAALPGTPEETPKFPGCGTCLPHCWDPQGAREGSHSRLISLVSIPSLGKTCQWRKARRGGGGMGRASCGQGAGWSPSQKSSEPRGDRVERKEVFLGHLLPKAQNKASWPVRCLIALQVSLSGTKRALWGQGGTGT